MNSRRGSFDGSDPNLTAFGDVHRTVPISATSTPRKISNTLGPGGIYYGSHDQVCKSYLSIESDDPRTKRREARRKISTPLGKGGLLFGGPDTVVTSYLKSRPPNGNGNVNGNSRSRRCQSEGRDLIPDQPVVLTLGRSRHTSRSNLMAAENAHKLLPPEAINQEGPPVLIIRKTTGSPLPGKVIDIYDQDNTDEKSAPTSSAADKEQRAKDATELEAKLNSLMEKLDTVSDLADECLKRQTSSLEFQRQLKKETEGFDLQRGVYRVIESVDGDRRESNRLIKKSVEMRKRQTFTIEYMAEDDELKGMFGGTMELEKKIGKSLEEIKRLQVKTEELINREIKEVEKRKKKMHEAAAKGGIMADLIKDGNMLDSWLKDTSFLKTCHHESDKLNKKIQSITQENEESDEMDANEIILERMRLETDALTELIIKNKEDLEFIQDAIVIGDEEVDVISETEALRRRYEDTKNELERLQEDTKEFTRNMNEQYSQLMDSNKAAREEEEAEQRRLEEEERLRREAEEAERLRKENEEKERLRLEAELKQQAAENLKKQKEEMMESFNCNLTQLQKMKVVAQRVKDKQNDIEKIQLKRRTLYTIPEEEEAAENIGLKKLVDRTSKTIDAITEGELELKRLKTMLPKTDDPSTLAKKMSVIEKSMKKEVSNLGVEEQETEDMFKRSSKLLEEAEEIAEEERKKREADLDQEAQENIKKQREEILECFNKDFEEVDKMKDLVSRLKEKQEDIDQIQRKRRKLYTIQEEDEIEEKQLLMDLVVRTSGMLDSLIESENELNILKSRLPTQDPEILLKDLVELEKNMMIKSQTLGDIQLETDNIHNKSTQLLEAGLNCIEEGESDKKDMQLDSDELARLAREAEEQRKRMQGITDAELAEEARRRQRELDELEAAMRRTEEELNTWKDFTWTETEETEMNKYGMISALAMPSFPLSLIKDKELLKKIMTRREEIRRIHREVVKEAKRMVEVMAAIEEMEQKQRENELKRLAAQAKEWTQDPIPYGGAMFGASPSFKSDFTMDPEEARERARSRKASRMNSREPSVAPVEAIGALRGYDDILMGYGARSRHQSVDRSKSKEEEEKEPQKDRGRTKKVSLTTIPLVVLDDQDDQEEINNQEEESADKYNKKMLEPKKPSPKKPPAGPRKGRNGK